MRNDDPQSATLGLSTTLHNVPNPPPAAPSFVSSVTLEPIVDLAVALLVQLSLHLDYLHLGY